MKTLLLIRHAKSSWNEPGLSDFERPLNDRGKKDAPEMAERLKEKGLKIDLIVSTKAVKVRVGSCRTVFQLWGCESARFGGAE
jgi:phosphohistidine phosphatase